MINFRNDDDANSTKLEGKKLKNRGVVIDGKYVIIEGVSGDLERDEVEREIDVELQLPADEETPEERRERERLERIALQKQQELLQQQLQQVERRNVPAGEKYNEIRDGIRLSQNRGAPVRNKDGTERNIQQEERQAQPEEKKLDVAAAKFTVGDNTEKLLANKENIDVNKLTPEQVTNLKNSMPAGNLQHKPGKGQGLDI